MSPLVAAVVLAWIVLIVLALALAGTIQQLRNLQGRVFAAGVGFAGANSPAVPPVPGSVRPAGEGARSLVLLTTPECPVCDSVVPVFDELARLHESAALEFVVLSPSAKTRADVAHARQLADATAFASLFPGWSPALVVVPRAGETGRPEPAGSAEAVQTLVALQLQGDRH